MKKTSLFLILSTSLIIMGCNDITSSDKGTKAEDVLSTVKPQNKPSKEIKSLPLTKAQTSVLNASLDFTKSIAMAMPSNQGYIISPLGIQYLIGMVGNAISSDERNDLLQIVFGNAGSWDEVNAASTEIIESLPALDLSSSISTANLFIYDKRCNGRISYENTLENTYGALVYAADFSDSQLADKINHWAQVYTNDKITEPIKHLDSDCRALFVSSLMFSSSWERTFLPENTYTGTFYNASGDRQEISFMNTVDYLEFYESANSQILKLPYGNGKFTMTIILPKDNNNVSLLNEITSEVTFYSRYIDLSMPKFEQNYKLNLQEALLSAGCKKIAVSFVWLGETAVPLKALEQEIAISFNEEGVCASSITSGHAGGAPIIPEIEPTPEKIVINHPFYYMLSDSENQVILFLGYMAGK